MGSCGCNVVNAVCVRTSGLVLYVDGEQNELISTTCSHLQPIEWKSIWRDLGGSTPMPVTHIDKLRQSLTMRYEVCLLRLALVVTWI